MNRLKRKWKEMLGLRSSFTYEDAAFHFLMTFTHSKGEQWSQGFLWAPRVRYALDPNKKIFTPTDLDWFETRIGRYLPFSFIAG